ncbi:MAG TPA: [protein-PII] uridylyltransferase [Candidatus Competibacteraceae bacterium]|nr:[protein-PII] uridylyltransferase [Candidatus Competibacteraceae bacterium]
MSCPPLEIAALDGCRLFDPAPFEQDLSSTALLLKVFRTALRQGDQVLRELFQQGVPAQRLVPARARLIDQLLTRAWVRFFPSDTGLALVAVGGYGRGELHPGSDVDIMILLDEQEIGQNRRAALEGFLTFLWDIGLEVGQSVRTLEDCVREGAADITVATNLMEARLLTGSPELFERMRELTGPAHIWPTPAFFEAKREEQIRRYRKYHDTAYNLEPNVKEGPGGLRDLQTVAWVAKRHFNAATLHDLVEHGFITEQEHATLLECQGFLWQVRFALHILTGRREDRLLFDYQRQLANQFGYRDQDHNLAVEQFMQRYYRTIMELSRLNEMLLQLFEEAILLADDPGAPVLINRRFQARKGYLEVTRANVFQRYPFALLELFLLLQQHPELKGVRASTVRLIRDHRHLLDDKFRADVRARSLFMEILRQPRCVTRQLRRMNRYGILAAYLPEFARIVGRMQYDLFHTYTVDQHTLFVVRNLRRFYDERFHHEFPHCSAVMKRIAKPELLYIAAIYHDIAKGRGGDHSDLGAHDAEAFCRRHGLGSFDTHLVSWLVRNHLLMSLTAQKKDIHDPDVVTEFAQQVGDTMRLDYLYLLTVADIRATNPRLWNNWRESLLRELYEATRRALRRGLSNPIAKAERIQEVQEEARVRLRQKGIQEARIETVWQGFSDDYFLRHSADEVAWHTRAVLKKADDGRALVLARRDTARGGTEVFVYTRDQDNLFALITAVLDQLGLTILDARIITSDNGYSLDSFTVVEDSGEPIQDRQRIKEILLTLRRELNRADAHPWDSSRRPPRVLKHFPTPTQVAFLDDDSNGRTILELSTADRPGLLSRIGRAFMDCGIRLQNAKIATIGARAEDIFFITDRDNRPLREPAQYLKLRETLIRYLDGGIG